MYLSSICFVLGPLVHVYLSKEQLKFKDFLFLVALLVLSVMGQTLGVDKLFYPQIGIDVEV
jgi:hypothetical protein